MAYTLQVGSIRCHILSDGLHYVDGGGFFGLIPRTHVAGGGRSERIQPGPLRLALLCSSSRMPA